MIILNISQKLKSLSQNKYNKLISSIDLSNVFCNKCDSNDWSYHCTYSRYIDIFQRNHKIEIQRVRCNCCGKTHAILIEDMIPYSCVPADILIAMLHSQDIPTSSSFLYFLKAKYINITLSYEEICIFNARNNPCLFVFT